MSTSHDKYHDIVQTLMKKQSEYDYPFIDCDSEVTEKCSKPLYEVFDYEVFENGEEVHIGNFSSMIFSDKSEDQQNRNYDFLYE